MTSYKWFTKEEVASWPEGHKKCRGCQRVLPLSDFTKQKQTLFGVANYCKDPCRKAKSKEEYSQESWEYKMWYRAKKRAKDNGREFTIRVEDIVIPNECPVFKQPFIFIAGSHMVPSLDRIDSSRGYTPDNIVVMSHRANWLKNNASKNEIRMLSAWMAINVPVDVVDFSLQWDVK
jgi:hypothetical protein